MGFILCCPYKIATLKKNEIEDESPILSELIHLISLPNFSNVSTNKLRTIIKEKCLSGNRNFNSNRQHDAGEFLSSIFEHIFEESGLPMNFADSMFGGIYQEKFNCVCINIDESPL